ncbi:MAG: hypothetical protein KatS3mg042_0397 [Rhodothermaceae bacterium]|nr:MAG: hypothetical protein KatS3mg042_0397 [Rhodothermaceae bacterium]
MTYRFLGHLCAYLCANCNEDLANVTIRLYRVRRDQPVTHLATAEVKHTQRVLDARAIDRKKKHLLAETTADEAGRFAFELDEKKHKYDGGSFEIDVRLSRAPGQAEAAEPVQFTVTTLQPQWRQRDNHLVAVWEHCLSARFWCHIRERLGAWVICGTVLDCKTRRPIPGVRVQAFDRDWWQDDHLGEGVTDANGHFRIDYTAAAFRPGVFIDVELFGGPDLYFRVETLLGAPLLVEPPSRGRDADRQNAGPCFCVELCLTEAPPPPVIEALPVFTHLGGYNYENDVNSLPGQNGLTKTSGRAFYSNVRLNGVLPKTLNGQPMEYRFEEHRRLDAAGVPLGPVDAGDVPNRSPRPTSASWNGRNPDPRHEPEPDHDGGLLRQPTRQDTRPGPTVCRHRMPTLSETGSRCHRMSGSALGDDGLSSTPNGNMISLITGSLAPFATVDLETPGPLAAGQSATATGQPLVQNRHFAIRMMVREVGTAGPGTVAGTCQNVAVENTRYRTLHHPAWMAQLKTSALAVAMVDVEELIVDGCSGIGDTLTVNYTAAHPNLGTITLTMTGPGGPYTLALTPNAGATPPNQFGTATLAPPDSVGALAPCAYIVTLSVQVLLTTGDSVPDNLIDQIAFCKA